MVSHHHCLSHSRASKSQRAEPLLMACVPVDTSTGVLSPAAHFCDLIKKHSPDTLIVLDAVCSVASEEIRFDDVSATQKGLGTPPGLSVCMLSGRAVKVGQNGSGPR
jgi:alanine-glyoxylate transaminase/serine-glyoxylate transaminase/serine-pyruvate transaminase